MDQIDEVKAMLAFGRVGVSMFLARILSVVGLVGIIGLGFYVAWKPTWEGVASLGILALCFARAVTAETGQRQPPQA